MSNYPYTMTINNINQEKLLISALLLKVEDLRTANPCIICSDRKKKTCPVLFDSNICDKHLIWVDQMDDIENMINNIQEQSEVEEVKENA